MKKPSIHIRIKDMLEAIETVDDMLVGLQFDTFEGAGFRGSRRGIERCIEIVSEASRHVPEDLKAQFQNIPWRNIRGIGNVLRHGYSVVDNRVIWRISTQSLPGWRQY